MDHNSFPRPPPPPPLPSHLMQAGMMPQFHPSMAFPPPPMPGHLLSGPPRPPITAPPMTFPPLPQQHMFPIGPVQPVIFEGHIVNNSPDVKEKENGGEATLFQEIQFGSSFKLEGIHIVPNSFTPPGFAVVGRTKPDLMTRPFALQLFGRNTANNEIVLLLSLTVQGGVQWMALDPELAEISCDYLLFSGDYLEITVLLHGIPSNLDYDGNLLPFNNLNNSKPLPPYPYYFNELIIPAKDLVEIRKFLPNFANDGEKSSFDDEKLQYIKETKSKPLKELLNLPLMKDIDASFFLSRKNRFHSKSLFSVNMLAKLVEIVFSLNTNSITELQAGSNYEVLLNEINSLTEVLTSIHEVE
jgi:hypothetical protein